MPAIRSQHSIAHPVVAVVCLTLVTLLVPLAASADDDGQQAHYGQSEVERRAEIRRTMDVANDRALRPSASNRRAMTAEERRRLREDIRASRDIYDLRDRPKKQRR